MRKLILLVLIFVVRESEAQPHFTWNTRVQEIYSSITSLRIPEARKWISIERKTDPENLVFHLMESYADLYELFFNENNNMYNVVHPQFDRRINLWKSGPQNNPFYRYGQAILLLHKAALAIRFEKNLEAAIGFRKSYLLFKENNKLHPAFRPNDFYFGMLTTLLGAVPNNYQWMLNMLGMEGSVAEGNRLVLRYLQDQDKYRDVCRNEALLAYPYLLLNFEGNAKKTLNFIQTAGYNFNRNHLHAYMATNIFLNNQRSPKAIDIASNIEKSDAYMPMPFWNFEKGYALLNQLQLDKAMAEFQSFTQQFKGKFYIKDAYEKLSWISYLKGDMKNAHAFRNQVISKGSTVTDADQSALDNATSGKWPNPILLKARLLSDGGLLDEALKVLSGYNSRSFATAEEKTEFSYRLGRIHDLMGETGEALRHYAIAIELGKNLKAYFAARAALQSGMIFEARKDPTQAVAFYKTCLNMKDHEFKNSLNQKAKAGLQRCQKK